MRFLKRKIRKTTDCDHNNLDATKILTDAHRFEYKNRYKPKKLA